MNGKHIELFLIDGSPGGLTTAEIIGWTGHVMRGERSQLDDFLRREEGSRNGAYILLGDDEAAPSGVKAYIGRTERIGDRLRQHRARKDFWDRFVVITTKDDTFTEGHWGYLEARLVELAKSADRAGLANDNSPLGRKLSEAQSSDMEAFIQQLSIVLPVLGVNVIRSRKTQQPPAPSVLASESPVFHLSDRKRGVDARAQLIDGEFTILEGSVIVGTWNGVGKADSTRRAYDNYRAQHEQLMAEGGIRADGAVTRDIRFASPSTAGAVALGRSCNGRKEWIEADGQMYGSWEARGEAREA
ncbi:MAG: GIY-YIG nuclease family protein [Brevibacterium aurantiacum]|uniref:GIY-YIG nuclease family protein n=1 Tax=Brevibacterium aurantiacum TaxID=273384 RepID=UPI003F903A88